MWSCLILLLGCRVSPDNPKDTGPTGTHDSPSSDSEGSDSQGQQDSDSQDSQGQQDSDSLPQDADADGFDSTVDCDDTDAAISPDAIESCDGIDNNCDGGIDTDAFDAALWYADADADGYGDAGATVTSCEAPAGYTTDATDCDDTNALISPANAERCNGVDDNCDTIIDVDATDAPTWFVDLDGDSYGDASAPLTVCEAPGGYVTTEGDCDDTNPTIYPGNTEVCDLFDNNCDGAIDEDAADAIAWYIDADGDGYGDAATSVSQCSAPAGYVSEATDCDDSNASRSPGLSELCNEVDDDCDGSVDTDAIDQQTWYTDADGDGFYDLSAPTVACASPGGAWSCTPASEADCDDANAAIFPGQEDPEDGVDNNCNGVVDPLGFCPPEMVPVPEEDPDYCMDIYEGSWDGSVVTSAAGMIPSTGISYDDAVTACAATPAYDADGAVYAYKYLPTSTEWEDAGDGVVGSGGSVYPYGDTWDDYACATLRADLTVVYSEIQPTGSLSTCVSPFGTYDQTGNLWEWTDSDLLVDSAHATAVFAARGVTLSEDSDGIVQVSGATSELWLRMVNLSPHTFYIDADSRLYLEASQISDITWPKGFFSTYDDTTGESAYPIFIEQSDPSDPSSIWWIKHDSGEDGQPEPDKRGCAYYVGGTSSCAVNSPGFEHTHDFSGTIGFRCAAPPYTR